MNDKTKFYIERVNQVIDYIEENLENKIDLDQLAGVASLSKYHFHRIFLSFTSESLYSFINRIRVEKAAALLLNPKRSITEIAFSCGFNDSATFSRAFKKHFKLSASEWKKRKKSKIDQDEQTISRYVGKNDTSKEVNIKTVAIAEEFFKQTTIAYVRHTGAYAGNSKLFLTLHEKLMDWAKPKGLVDDRETKEIVIYHDPLGITDSEKLRISVGIPIPEELETAGEIGKIALMEGNYLVCRFELKNDEYGKAWTHVYRDIIPQRGLQPDDGLCFEMYSMDCYNPETGTTCVAICIPVKPL